MVDLKELFLYIAWMIYVYINNNKIKNYTDITVPETLKALDLTVLAASVDDKAISSIFITTSKNDNNINDDNKCNTSLYW